MRRLKNVPPSCTDCHEILAPHPPGTLRPVQGLLDLTLNWPICSMIHIQWQSDITEQTSDISQTEVTDYIMTNKETDCKLQHAITYIIIGKIMEDTYLTGPQYVSRSVSA